MLAISTWMRAHGVTNFSIDDVTAGKPECLQPCGRSRRRRDRHPHTINLTSPALEQAALCRFR